jgi:LuxR family transcriptional regulator, maltose regulon positive regulatory protein
MVTRYTATMTAQPCRPATGAVVDRRALFGRLAHASRVAQITAPPGSGKTLLLRSWIGEAGLAESVGWVSVQREERDAQRFWISVIEAGHPAGRGPVCR